MKQRFSSLDLQVIAHELSTTITSYRLSNIYDLTSRIFLLKFAKPESKHLLLIDSGFRCHLTSFSRATATTPSSFVAKLRKCLRTRRVTRIRQIGTDRVLELEFSAGEYKMYLEFYAGGNVILVDKTDIIVAVLRIVKGGEGGAVECKVGVKYELSNRTTGGDLTARITDALTASITDEGLDPTSTTPQGSSKKFKKKKKKKGEEAVTKILSSRLSEFSPTLIEHCFLTTGVDLDIKAEDALSDASKLSQIVGAFQEAERMITAIMADTSSGITGYIIAKAPRTADPAPPKPAKGVSFTEPSFASNEAIEHDQTEKIQESGEAAGLVYTDFFPFLPSSLAPGTKAIPVSGYNNTVDTFFSSIESQKLVSRIAEREATAAKRLESARTEHARRVEGLRSAQDLNVAKAQAIEANLERVEEVIAAVNGLVAQGMDWAAMGSLIEQEQKRGNAVAELIKLPLKLHENTVTIILSSSLDPTESDPDPDSSADETDSSTPTATPPKLEIDLDLDLSAYANASHHFTAKKTLHLKESKTLQSSTLALASTSRKITSALKKSLQQEKSLLHPVRQPFWFEKFLFFISSDGYLVLAGRDAQQTEIIYQRHFRRGDVFVSADIEGAGVCVVKNWAGGGEVPPGTLGQAGTLSVAVSKAWESKSVMGAWWVGFEQVRKTAGGEYLDAGRFDIKGGKNYLPPAQLVLGYGVMWCVDEEGRKRHGRFRVGGESVMGQEAGDVQREQTTGEQEVDEKEKVEDEEMKNEEERKDEERKDEEEEKRQEELEEEKAQEELEEPEDDSDEEFPDAQIESGEESKEPEESSDEDFPDASIQEKDLPKDSAPADPDKEEETGETGDTKDTSSRTSTATGSKHLSAKARRELRKARTGTPTDTPTGTSTPTTTSKPTAPAPVRGKKGKQKKLATKYAHQSPEDRALALQLLGSAPAAPKPADPSISAAAKAAEAAVQKQRRREQHARALAAEAARHQHDDNEDEDTTTQVPLDCFVGTPMPGDNLLSAVPVCAPWGAMGRYKYKAKLQPGSVKKGKAVKDVVGRWLAEGEKKLDMKSEDVEKMWPRERELILGWKEAEIINCVGVSKVKVFGGSAGAGGKGGSGGGKRGGRGGKRK